MSNDRPAEGLTHYAVIGVNKYPDDGFELIATFETEEGARKYIETYSAEDAAEYGWERYYATEVSHHDH